MAKKKTKDFGGPVDLEVDPFTPNGELELEADTSSNVVEMEIAPTENPVSELIDNPATDKHLAIGGIEIALPSDIDSCWRYATDKMNLSVISAAQAGYALINLKENLPHGEFEKQLAARGFNARESRRSMLIAKTLLDKPDDVQKALTKMNKSQLIEIAKLDDEQFEAIQNADELDELSMLSVQELRKKVRETQTSLETKKLQLEDAKSQISSAQQRSMRWPESVLHVREESSMALLNIIKQADDLESQLNYMQSAAFAKDITHDDVAQASTERKAAAGAVHHALATALVRLHKVYEEYKDRDGIEYMVEDLVPQLDEVELRRVGVMWNIDSAIEKQKKDDAKRDRINEARAGKRGRPVGS